MKIETLEVNGDNIIAGLTLAVRQEGRLRK